MRRRAVLAGCILAWCLGLASAGRGAEAQSADPDQTVEGARATAFIRAAGKDLAAIVQDHGPERRPHLQAFLGRVVDIDGLARFCLGRFWNQASETQRAAFTAIYHGVLLNAVLARVGDYGGPAMQLVFGRAENRDGVMLVPTIVDRPGQPKAAVTWALRMDGPTPRIVDLIVEGTSLRVTVRSDYAAFLQSHDDNIDALIDALRRQAAAPAN